MLFRRPPSAPAPPRRPVVALLTDFGLRDHYVGSMKGAVARACPEVLLIDIAHDVQRHSIAEAAYLLWASYRFFPHGTVFVAVVDPGVGTERKILITSTPRHLFLAPDNGLMDLVWGEEPSREVRVLHDPGLLRARAIVPQEISSTFHGRDLFAPVAGWLAGGGSAQEIGALEPRLPAEEMFVSETNRPSAARILHLDRFGNIVTNLRATPGVAERLRGVTVGRRRITLRAETFAEGRSGKPCLMAGSSKLIEIVLKNGNAATFLGVSLRTKVRLHWGTKR